MESENAFESENGNGGGEVSGMVNDDALVNGKEIAYGVQKEASAIGRAALEEYGSDHADEKVFAIDLAFEQATSTCVSLVNETSMVLKL